MKQIYITLGIISLFCVPVNAATQCVALNSSTACTGTPTSGKVDWTMTCGGIPVTGVGVCSSTAGSSRGQTADTLATQDTTDANKYCWCKMTSPAVSRFVFSENRSSAAACSLYCADRCVLYAINLVSFREGLFSGLAN